MSRFTTLHTPKMIRARYDRQGGRCLYCGGEMPWGSHTLDHVIPLRRGGRAWWSNIVLACRPCNQRKGHRPPTPDELKRAEVVLGCPANSQPDDYSQLYGKEVWIEGYWADRIDCGERPVGFGNKWPAARPDAPQQGEGNG